LDFIKFDHCFSSVFLFKAKFYEFVDAVSSNFPESMRVAGKGSLLPYCMKRL